MNRKRMEGEQWRQHVQEQARSGLSIAGYARQQGLSESIFYAWRRRLQGEKEKPGFIRIDAERAKAAAVIITTPNGYRVEALTADVGVATARALAQTC